MSPTSSYLVFLQSPWGLASLLADEVRSLGYSLHPKGVLPEGVELRVSREELWRLCLELRLAEAVWVRMKLFSARHFNELRDGVAKLPLHAWLAPGTAVAVRAVCHRSKLIHSGAVEERVTQVFTERFGLALGREDEGAVGVLVRVHQDQVQLSLNAGGYRLHRRGQRACVERGSLRETLAAAVVSKAFQSACALHDVPSDHPAVLSKPVGKELTVQESSEQKRVLWDPFCGAGTILLEAVSWAEAEVPALRRKFAFEQFKNFSQSDYVALCTRMKGSSSADSFFEAVIGSDISSRALEATRANFAGSPRANVVQLHQGRVEEIASSIPRGAWVMTNPPYGKRIAERGALKKFYRVLEERPDLRVVSMIMSSQGAQKLPSFFERAERLKNGGLNAVLCQRKTSASVNDAE
ncbi:MAG: hypothetical protein MK135_03835 [Polyangiaceae bacterium]|nr:hypothetical protein [Polyangiaceae bacterium]